MIGRRTHSRASRAVLASLCAAMVLSACDASSGLSLEDVAPRRVMPLSTLELVGHGFCGEVPADGACAPVSQGGTTISLGGAVLLAPADTVSYTDERISLVVPDEVESGAIAVVVSVDGIASLPVVIEVVR